MGPAIVGGALYANRWHSAARRFIRRREDELRKVPVPTALGFTATVGLLDLMIVAGLIQHSLAMFGSIAGTTGEVMSTLPWVPPGKVNSMVTSKPTASAGEV